MKKAFTLIEMMIAVSILSLMMLFLYKSYADLNRSNKFFKTQAQEIKTQELIKQTLFLDIYLALDNGINILNQGKNLDIVYTQTSHSLHKKYNPYLAYTVNDSKLYRLESLTPFTNFPIPSDKEFTVDYLGEVNTFKLYKSTNKKKNSYFLHVDFKKQDKVLLKISRG